jgi:acyl-CoA synthetase (AMP-forming)/AMP-acid ligase II
VTTLVWPSEAISKTVLDTLIGPGGPFELREEEVLGARMLVFTNRPRSIIELLQRAADRMGDKPYVIFPEREYTFALGAVTVGLNGWWTGEEIAYALELTEPKLLLGDGRRLSRLEGVDLPADLSVLSFEDDFAALESYAPDAEFPDVALDEDDPFVILFTSGTTGRPKGVMLSHRNNIHFLLASMLNGAAAAMTDAEQGIPMSAPPERSVIISAAPMFHIAGLNCQLVAATVMGQTIVYAPPGRWQEETHLELTQRHGATTWALVPTQLWRILDVPDLADYDTSSVRNVGGGSAVWPPELLRTLAERIPSARGGTALGYGSTETVGLGTTLRPGAELAHTESIGLPSATMQVQVRDSETDEVLPEGEVGEICLRGGSVFLGYWRNPDATARALDADRWYRTGDVGVIRDGYVYLEGRRQDLIIRGGENISPVEIENRLFEHPEIAEVAVVGVDHPQLGQEVAAFVVPHTHGALTEAEVQDWVAETLAGFKVPSKVEFRDELPHNASGKVLKHLLSSPEKTSDFVEE